MKSISSPLRLLAIFLPVTILSHPYAAAAADVSDTLDTIVTDLCTLYALNETNFSLCYYNTITGESYSYNPDTWMIAGSTYKLPLNMYYYELENSGEISSDLILSGYTLQDIHYESIVNSNNELSEALLFNLGSYQTYKELMFTHYGGLKIEDIDEIAWHANYFTARYMINTLDYLNENSGQFEELLQYMLQAAPHSYFKKYVVDYEIAHKYGSYDSAENDVGIIYTEEPYLLAVYTYGIPGGEDVVGKINQAVCSYNLAHTAAGTVQQVQATVSASLTSSDTEVSSDTAFSSDSALSSDAEVASAAAATSDPKTSESSQPSDESSAGSVPASSSAVPLWLTGLLGLLAAGGSVLWKMTHWFLD